MGRESYSTYLSRLRVQNFIRKMEALPEERRTNRAAGKIIDLWRSRLKRGAAPIHLPTLEAAIRARRPWLSYECPACLMIGQIDVRSFDRHPRASIESLIPSLSCPRCPNGPHVRLLDLQARRECREPRASAIVESGPSGGVVSWR